MTDSAFDLLRRFQMLQPDQRDTVNTVIDSFLAKRAEPPRFKAG